MSVSQVNFHDHWTIILSFRVVLVLLRTEFLCARLHRRQFLQVFIMVGHEKNALEQPNLAN